MALAALYDIHGNLPALEAVLADVRRAGVDGIVVGGDVVPGPMPRETIALLRAVDIPVQFIHGNGDRVVVAQRHGGDVSEVPDAFREIIRWTAEQVDEDTARWMATWPLTLRMSMAGFGDVVFCHATPRNDTDVFTRLTAVERLRPIFDPLDAAVVICGHTHMPFDRVVGTTRVVNAGSVGMPFGGSGAYWLRLGAEIELRRTSYDLEAAAARIRETRYPQAAQFAASNVLQTPSEQEMLDAFAKAEVQ